MNKEVKYPEKVYLVPQRAGGGYLTGFPAIDWSRKRPVDPLAVEYIRADLVETLRLQNSSLVEEQRNRSRLAPGEDEYDHRHWM